MAFSTCRYILISAATPQVVDGVDRILLFLLASCFLHVSRPPEVDEAHDWGGCVDGRVWPRQWLGADQAFAKKVRLCGKRKEARPSLAPRIPRAGGQENEWLACVATPVFSHLASRTSHLDSRLSPLACGLPIMGIRMACDYHRRLDYHSTAPLMHTRIFYSAAMTLMMATDPYVFKFISTTCQSDCTGNIGLHMTS